jgi:hypothetical protein
MDEGSREIKRIIPVKSQAGSDKKDGRSGPRFYLFFLFAKGTKNLIRLCYLIVFLVFFPPKKCRDPPALALLSVLCLRYK